MPNLLKFLTGNGTLITREHTPLIAHTADDSVTLESGLYGATRALPHPAAPGRWRCCRRPPSSAGCRRCWRRRCSGSTSRLASPVSVLCGISRGAAWPSSATSPCISPSTSSQGALLAQQFQRLAHLHGASAGCWCRSWNGESSAALGLMPKRIISSAAITVISASCAARRVVVDVGVDQEHLAIGQQQAVHAGVGVDAGALADHLVDVVQVQRGRCPRCRRSGRRPRPCAAASRRSASGGGASRSWRSAPSRPCARSCGGRSARSRGSARRARC